MELSVDEINSILKSALANREFEIISCEKKREDGYVPIGFLSVQKRYCVIYKSEGRIEELNLFSKCLPESEFHKNIIISNGAFSKEVILFRKFLVDLQRKTQDHSLPTCYLAKDNDKIVLNDLSKLGFSCVPLLQTYTVEHCEKAIESIVKLHSGSIIFEIKNKCKIEEHIPVLMEETIYSNDENHVSMKAVKVGLKALNEFVKIYFPEYPEELREKAMNALRDTGRLLKPSLNYPNVLSHTDLWGNNLMFRYDGTGKVLECCLIDFQLASLKPLTLDLQMMIHLCTDKALRESHYEHLMKYYYTKLSESLSFEGVDISLFLPWDSYTSLFNETLPLTLAMAPQYLHFVLMPDDIIRDVLKDDAKYAVFYLGDRAPFLLKGARENPAYRSRILNAFYDLFEYLKADNAVQED